MAANMSMGRAASAARPSNLGRALIDLQRAESLIDQADLRAQPAQRYLGAHGAALQIAAVILATRTPPGLRVLPGPRNTWALVARVAPESAEWAAYFDSLSVKRHAVEAGASGLVTEREADDLIRDARLFAESIARRLEAAIVARARGGELEV